MVTWQIVGRGSNYQLHTWRSNAGGRGAGAGQAWRRRSPRLLAEVPAVGIAAVLAEDPGACVTAECGGLDG